MSTYLPIGIRRNTPPIFQMSYAPRISQYSQYGLWGFWCHHFSFKLSILFWCCSFIILKSDKWRRRVTRKIVNNEENIVEKTKIILNSFFRWLTQHWGLPEVLGGLSVWRGRRVWPWSGRSRLSPRCTRCSPGCERPSCHLELRDQTDSWQSCPLRVRGL